MSKTCGHEHVTVPNCATCRIAELEAENKTLREACAYYQRQLAAALEADDE